MTEPTTNAEPHAASHTGSGIERIAAERERQLGEWTNGHDRQHTAGELARAGAWYALPLEVRGSLLIHWQPDIWPDGWVFKPATPDNRVRDLEKAGALIAAEIDRLLADPIYQAMQRVAEEG